MSEVAVVDVDLVGPARAEQLPVLEVDPRRVANQDLGDLRFVGVHIGEASSDLIA